MMRQHRGRERPSSLWLPACGLLFLLGCSSGPARVEFPGVVPEEAARQAFADYDKNKDGFLDAQELQRCPALLQALRAVDKDHDGKISVPELTERLASFYKGEVGQTALSCRVFLDGSPLEGARVTFVPEKFLGPSVKPAAGETDRTGLAALHIEGAAVPGVHLGYYRVEISRKDNAGREMLPARYNTQTGLGQEVSRPSRLEFRLVSP